MEDSMLDLPDLVFDEKASNKRLRDGEEEINIGRLEKRPSGILVVNGGGDCDEDRGNEGWEAGGGGGGIIDTFISNVFHQNESVIGGEAEVGDLMKTDVVVEDKSEDLCIDGSGGHGGDGESGGGCGGGTINTFIANIFHHNGSGDDGGDQAKSDLFNEVVEKTEDLDAVGHYGEDGGGGLSGGVERADLDPEKPSEKINIVPGEKLKMRPDDYSERVFFLNNN